MATMQYTVWDTAAEVALGPVLQENVVAIGGVSAQSAAIIGSGRRARKVRIFCDTNAFVTWGSNPVAKTDGTDGRMIGAENPEYIYVEAGEKLAVIQRT